MRGEPKPEDYENIRIQSEIMKKGLEIIPNELWIRHYTQTDIERFSKHLEDAGYKPPIPTEKQLLIEYSYSDTIGWRFASPGDIVILALKLVRKGRIVEDYSYTIEKETDKITLIPLYIFGVSPHYVPTSFYLYPSDAIRIRDLFQKLMNYEWKRTDPLRLAIEYFSRACNELNPEDKIIELCKGYEALFTEGKRVKRKIREHLATECSDYLSEIYDKEQVYEIINDVYQVRNDIMHGRLPSHYTRELVDQFEEYLRCSLREKILTVHM